MKTQRAVLKKPKLLIADHNKYDLKCLRNLFWDVCRVYLANNSTAAERILAEKMDIVLVDFGLKPDSGIELAGKAKKLYPKSLVIFIAGSADLINNHGRFQCLEKNNDKAFVASVMNFWRLHNGRPRPGEFYGRYIDVELRSPHKELESITGRLAGSEIDRLKWVVYSNYNYPGHQGIADICIAPTLGCPGGCLMCKSGKERPFKRKLTGEEIVSQVWHAQHSHLVRESDAVTINLTCEGDFIFNWQNVCRALKFIIDNLQLNLSGWLGGKHDRPPIIITTIGNSQVIREFLDSSYMALPVTFYWSVHSLIKEKRDWLMPATKGESLERGRDLFEEFYFRTGRKSTINWMIVKGFNNSLEDAEMIVDFF
ncbi:MAG: hypothetical protein Q8O93_00670 [bacterium]|nr:hypothetical protein [bacterium]